MCVLPPKPCHPYYTGALYRTKPTLCPPINNPCYSPPSHTAMAKDTFTSNAPPRHVRNLYRLPAHRLPKTLTLPVPQGGSYPVDTNTPAHKRPPPRPTTQEWLDYQQQVLDGTVPGKVFNKLICLTTYPQPDHPARLMAQCWCACGNKDYHTPYWTLVKRVARKCNLCTPPPFKERYLRLPDRPLNLTGAIKGYLYVLDYQLQHPDLADPTHRGATNTRFAIVWRAQCACGAHLHVTSAQLLADDLVTCGARLCAAMFKRGTPRAQAAALLAKVLERNDPRA